MTPRANAALITADMERVLHGASQIVVGVTTTTGPHTTPELFAWKAGCFWCLTAATTVKARVLAGGGPVSVAAVAGRSAVVVVGDAVVIDPASPSRALGNPLVALTAPRALASFGVRNVAELAGAAFDYVAGRLGGPFPPHRVLLCIRPKAAASVGPDGIAETTGAPAAPDGWQPTPPVARGGGEDLVEGLPPGFDDLAGDGAAFLGWMTMSGGPVVLPATWQADRCRALVSTGLLEWAGATARSRASVVRDEWRGFGPSGKRGVMLRGSGILGAQKAGTTTAELDVDGVAYWDGVAVGRVTGGA